MSELGDLLELLHRAQQPFETLRASYRTWTHHERAHAAFTSFAQGRRSVAIAFDPDREPRAESEYVQHIWRAPARARVERGADDRGYIGVRDGAKWWSWSKDMGATSNEGDPEVHSGIGEELQPMLDPTSLSGVLRLTVTGRGEVAGRPTIIVDAEPRYGHSEDGRWGGGRLVLHGLGAGAERYVLEVDADRGVVLSVEAIRGGLPFQRTEAVEISFDETLDEETFVFRVPPGERVRSPRERTPRPQHIPITKAQRRAPFNVLMPNRTPAGWTLTCIYVGPSERPRSGATVGLSYRSESGHEDVSIMQGSTADEHPLERTEGWEKVAQREESFEVRELGHQAQLRMKRDTTFVLMTSETLSSDQLAEIAARLEPAPDQSEV